MSSPRFSVVIPAYNEESRIGSCIESIRSNNRDDAEIVVVDNGSADETVRIAGQAGAKVLLNSEGRRRTIARLRNLGAAESNGEILVFLDADMLVPPDWLSSAEEYFSEGFRGALGFVDIVPEDAGWVAQGWWDNRQGGRKQAKPVDFLNGRNIFVDRRTFEDVFGFDETLRTCEDKDFSLRVCSTGKPLFLVSSPRPVHLGYDPSLLVFIRKEFWRQGNTLLLARRHGFSLRTLKNPFLSAWHVAAFLGLFLSLFLNPYVALVALVAWVLPAAAVTYRRRHRRRLTALPAFFLLTFIRWNVAGAALLRQLAMRERKFEKTV